MGLSLAMLLLPWLKSLLQSHFFSFNQYNSILHPLSGPTLGAVACESSVCSDVGASLLQQGGTAADAMVGSVLCVGVISMYHTGIGGGGLALVHTPNGKHEAVDFRESAPSAAHEHMYSGNIEGSVTGGLASGVPGELRGLEYLHGRYGRLPWREVVQPSVRLARDGFNVTEDIVNYLEAGIKRSNFLVDDPAWAEDFAPNGRLLRLGEVMTRRRYADTLDAVAESGAAAFYRGPVAERTIQKLRNANGSMTLDDLGSYRIAIREPVQINYRAFTVAGVGAPGSGAVVLSALKTVEGYHDMGNSSAVNISTHRLDEATRFAYAERASLGDPDFIPAVTELQEKMLDATYAASKQARIRDDHTLTVSDYNPEGFEIIMNHGTSHLSAADSSGLAISLTSTVNTIWGSLVMTDSGVPMNNQMSDFSIPHANNNFGYRPSPSNYIRPGKRPMSSMTPIIVSHAANGSLFHLTGAAGGARIITATLQDIWHSLDRGMSARAAVREPRFHDMLLPNEVSFEWALNRTAEGHHRAGTNEESGIGTGELRGFDNRTVAFMAARGHNVSWVPAGLSETHTIRVWPNGTFEAAGDPRQVNSGGSVVIQDKN